MSENVKDQAGLKNISEYIKNLKFKSTVVGGVDKEDVFVAIQEIYHLFSESYGELEQQLNSERERADNAAIVAQSKAQEEMNKLKEKTAASIAEAQQQAEQKSKAQLEAAERMSKTRIEEAEKKSQSQVASLEQQYKKQLDDMTRQLDKAKNTARGDELQRTVEKYESELALLRHQSGEREKELQQKLDIEQAARIQEQDKAGKQQLAKEVELSSQIETLQGQLALKEAEIVRKDNEHARELELAKSASAARGETLEEIYIEARAARDRAITAAQEEADALRAAAEQESEAKRNDTEQELETLRAAAQTEADEIHRNNEQQIADAQVQVAQLLAQAKQAAEEQQAAASRQSEENNAHCKELLAQAEKAVVAANEKAVQIVAVARQDYQREREKYNEQLLKLGDLRAHTVNDLQSAVSKFNNLMFEMSGAGIQANTTNNVVLSKMDEAVSAMEPEADNAADNDIESVVTKDSEDPYAEEN